MSYQQYPASLATTPSQSTIRSNLSKKQRKFRSFSKKASPIQPFTSLNPNHQISDPNYQQTSTATTTHTKNTSMPSEIQLDLSPYYQNVYRFMKSQKNANVFKLTMPKQLKSNRRINETQNTIKEALPRKMRIEESEKQSFFVSDTPLMPNNENEICDSPKIQNQAVLKFKFSKSCKKKNITKSIDISKPKVTPKLKPLIFGKEDFGVKDIINQDLEQIDRNLSDRSDNRLGLLSSAIEVSQLGFQRYFKEKEKLKQFRSLYKLKDNLYAKMVDKIDELNLAPRTIKLIPSTQSNDNFKSIHTSNFFGGNDYIQVLAEGIQSNSYQYLRRLELKQNSLKSPMISQLCEKLPQSLQYLDLSNNKIDKTGIASLIQFLSKKTSNSLKFLNIENNQLFDNGAIQILESLMDHTMIRSINLSMNHISDKAAETLSNLLKKNFSLAELYLHYNQITHIGGIQIFKALQKNQYLRVLDMSFNQIGMKECAQAVAITLGKPHPELIHLDLSYNGFSENDLKIISEKLIFNQIVYGIHFEGNSKGWIINPKGYLVNNEESNFKKMLTKFQEIQQDQDDELSEQRKLFDRVDKVDNLYDKECNPKFFRRIQSVDCIGPRKDVKYTQVDCCWICEGWQEVKFVWHPGKSGPIMADPVFLHLDFENYKPKLMNKEDDYYCSYRMCPPGQKIKYFFTNPLENLQIYAKDQKTTAILNHEPLCITGVPLLYADGTLIPSQRMSHVNYVLTNENIILVDSSKHYTVNVYSKPREPERIVEIDPQLTKQRIWSIENSFFRDFQSDSIGHLEECFEFDFSCGRFIKSLRNPQEIEELKQTLRVVYKHVLACYKYYSSLSLNYDYPIINSVSFNEFISQTTIMQKRLMKQLDLDISILSTNSLAKISDYKYMTEKALVRFQFLEIIMRMANEQYLRKGLVNTIGEAVKKLFDSDEVLAWVKEFGVSQEWRDERYWTQYMDMTIKQKMPLLKLLFDYAYKLSIKPHTGFKYISAQDFFNFFDQAGLVPKHITEQELYLIFLQSIMTQVDELDQLRHVQMTFIEFVEGLARVAEKISPSSPSYPDKNLTTKKRRVLPLFVKFEGICFYLYANLKTQIVKIYQQKDKILTFDKNILTSTVIQSTQARKLGVKQESSSEDDDSDKDSEKSTQKLAIQIPQAPTEQMILKQLFYEEENDDWEKKTNSPANSFVRNSLRNLDNSFVDQNSQKLKGRKNEYRAKLNTFYSSNIMKKLQSEQQEVDMLEQAEMEDSSPTTKLKKFKMAQKRSEFSKQQLEQETFKFA